MEYYKGSVSHQDSPSFEQWDSITAKFTATSNIPWLGILTGLLGNLSFLSCYSKKREKEVIVVQTLGVISIDIVFSQLGTAESMPLYFYVFISVVVAAGMELNFLNYFGKLSPGIWSGWEVVITVGGFTALPQPQVLFLFLTFTQMAAYLLCSTFVPYIPHNILPGAAVVMAFEIYLIISIFHTNLA